jgi:hypothetical protein
MNRGFTAYKAADGNNRLLVTSFAFQKRCEHLFSETYDVQINTVINVASEVLMAVTIKSMVFGL